MAVQSRLMTADEFFDLPEIPGKRFELVRGELVEMTGTGYRHSRLVRFLQFRLDAFATERGLGEVSGDNLSYRIARAPDIVRVPDVAFVTKEHLPTEDWEGFMPVAPDLAVEVVSPNDRPREVDEKVHEYLGNGTRLVWVVWPKRQAVTVHIPDNEARELGMEDELDGGAVLPGFRVRVADLFAVHR